MVLLLVNGKPDSHTHTLADIRNTTKRWTSGTFEVDLGLLLSLILIN